ncbi:MAG: HEAT repeat domain-containing protein [Planctomycetes bacterium]|nr:HEAT repeat domain-containing protein [Planctomycetota bacterium]
MLAPRLVLSSFLSVALVALAAGCATTRSGDDGVDVSRGNATTSALLRQQVEEMRFMHQQELLSRMQYLASMGEDASPAVCDGAKSDDWLVRSSCMWVLGAIGDRRNVEVVASGLHDKVPVVRYQAASTLARLGDGRGFPVLVEGLADSDLQSRYKCFQALKTTTGQDFGYQHDGAPDERRQAVGRWLDWLDGIKSSAL